MSIDGNSNRGAMTLAFSLSAVERLEDSMAVFEDAQNWSQHVGVVDNDLDAVERAVEEYGLRQDFDLDDRDKWLALEEIRGATPTRRHVYVGTAGEDRRVSTHLGWEFVSVTEAAEKAGWALSDGESEGGVLTRLRKAVSDGLFPIRP
ncbi:DUF7124 domain-containing protein [Halocatena marina]|uniref:DUF7124 domain-containing protein n=1 Tax=Halocatena marina TaxID=2934937 RepID=UPI00200F5212|nr:hypothetical protein [Halocatena marina]